MNTMTVKDVINLSHGKIEVRFNYDGENHFIKLLSDDISKLKHCVNKVNSMWAVSYIFCIYAEGTPKFESDNIEEKTDMKDKIALIASAQNFIIKDYDFNNNQLEIRHKNSNLCALIHNKDICYFITDISGSISDLQSLDMNCLMELKEFCEMLVKD